MDLFDGFSFMNTFEKIGFILMLLGTAGCFVNKVPGPLVAFLGIVVVSIASKLHLSIEMYIVCTTIIAASMVVSWKLMPFIASKLKPYGKEGSWGTFAGAWTAIILAILLNSGVLLFILLLLLTFGFAWWFEYNASKDLQASCKRALFAWIMYLITSFYKFLILFICIKLIEGDLKSHSIGLF